MEPKFEIKTKGFSDALREYQEATGKDMVDVLNRAAKNVAYKAQKLTGKANKSAIEAFLTHNRNSFRILNAQRLKKGLKALGGKEMSDAVRKFIKQRLASVAYIKAGWVPAILAFGGTFRGKVSEKSHAAEGYGEKAREKHLEAVIGNNSTGADKIGAEALDEAMEAVTKDMEEFAAKRMAETARKHSGA